ncbi:hypothetical protein PPYR_14347 [Photinus pyralis]|uniref:Phosphodiesterase n=2 Tax=Photinus pyralis TaxID=7054 RepID=A0A5N4A525_PHOPY|nr:probable 3',5'-cyclic phosphodiesterase pde-5 isoform X2 [Photinus pyralis]KAB0792388.1 hypothetical protein PPYR_14347 [Photinus pyralis]
MWSTITDRIANFLRGKRRHRSSPSKQDANSVRTNTDMTSQITADQVYEFLHSHPDYLEHYIMDEVELEQLERWIIRKSQRLKKKHELPVAKNGRKTSLSRWKFCVHADKRQMLQDLTHSLQLRPTKNQVLWELANCICSAVNADGFRLYLPDPVNSGALLQYLGENLIAGRLQEDGPIDVSTYVAKTREAVRVSKGDNDSRFIPDLFYEDDVGHILCQAVTYPDGQLAAVLELWRRESEGPFHEEDEEIACSYLVWGGIALHYAHLYLNMNQQRKLNDFLLTVVKSIFQDMVSMDVLVIKIMNFAQRLVDADRASLFLVDAKNQELYATIFDVGVENTDETTVYEGEEFKKMHTSKEIRFPLGTGIAGEVAMSGEILNITDAYADARFNRTVDQLTGYRTNTILCMPIFIRGAVIGVVQMVNKHSGYFTKEDEEAFEMFAVYCGLALHHAKLYDKIRRSEQKHRVALEVLSYHNTCTEEELATITDELSTINANVDDFYFNPFQWEDYQKAGFVIRMFTDLFGLTRFDEQSLLRFVLTVKKNYRRVPYHNWSHGFSVAHCMYCIIKNSRDTFLPNESLALFIAALCHDLDHRGKNNKFMLDTEAPLAAIYSTSTMEHHHFNQTVTILQQEGHNIFSKLSSAEYKQVLSLIKHCILATDLALFFPNRTKLAKLVHDDAFSWSNHEHRMMVQALSMTASDLCASTKPWDVQLKIVHVIFEEFYDQGDAERAAGRKPIPMMDRFQPDYQPASQVGFLSGICAPCYALLKNLIPDTEPLLAMVHKNLDEWTSIDQEIQQKKKNEA